MRNKPARLSSCLEREMGHGAQWMSPAEPSRPGIEGLKPRAQGEQGSQGSQPRAARRRKHGNKELQIPAEAPWPWPCQCPLRSKGSEQLRSRSIWGPHRAGSICPVPMSWSETLIIHGVPGEVHGKILPPSREIISPNQGPDWGGAARFLQCSSEGSPGAYLAGNRSPQVLLPGTLLSLSPGLRGSISLVSPNKF